MDEFAVTNEKSQLWPQFLTGINAILMAVSCGLHFGWPSPTIPKLQHSDLQFEVSKEEISYIVMISPLGYVIGCPLSAFLLDRIGRKPSILLMVVPQILAWFLIANSKQVETLYVARLTAGVAEGGAITSVPVYICEVSEPRIRGALGASYAIGMLLGSFLINFYGSFTSIRTSAYISLSLPILFLVTFIWMPESPHFFLIKGRIDNARRSLQKLRRMNNVEDELTKLTYALEKQFSEPRHIKDVFVVPRNLRALIILIGLRTLQQFSGGSAISFYNQMIFHEAGDDIPPVVASIIYYGVVVVSCFCCTFIIDKFGRKPLLICSTIGTGFSLLAEGWMPLTALVFSTIARAIGLTPIPTLITGEVFSASVKAKAVGMANIYLALCLSTSAKLFHWLSASFGMHVPFFFYASICAVGVLFVHYYIPETNKKTLEEIQQDQSGTT